MVATDFSEAWATVFDGTGKELERIPCAVVQKNKGEESHGNNGSA
jgi:hypothetical protein